MSEQLTPTQRVKNATGKLYSLREQPHLVPEKLALELATELERVKAELKTYFFDTQQTGAALLDACEERDQLKRQVEELKREIYEIISLRGLGDRNHWKACAEKAVEALIQISKRDDWTSGECRYYARQAIDEARG